MASAELEAQAQGYTLTDVTTGLTAVALCGGNATRAAEQLEQQGTPIPRRTLHSWKDNHSERYRDICNTVAPQIEAHVIHLQRELALKATKGAQAAVDLEIDRITKGDVKDAASSARNLSTVAGIAVDKLLSLTGRPTSVIEHRNADQTISRLSRLGLVVDSTADELTEDIS